jgi:hypothetical protein
MMIRMMTMTHFLTTKSWIQVRLFTGIRLLQLLLSEARRSQFTQNEIKHSASFNRQEFGIPWKHVAEIRWSEERRVNELWFKYRDRIPPDGLNRTRSNSTAATKP